MVFADESKNKLVLSNLNVDVKYRVLVRSESQWQQSDYADLGEVYVTDGRCSLMFHVYFMFYVSCLREMIIIIIMYKQKHENYVLLTEDSVTGILLHHHLLLAMAAVSGGRLSGGYLALVIAASVVFLLASIAAVYTMVRSVYTTVYRHVSK